MVSAIRFLNGVDHHDEALDLQSTSLGRVSSAQKAPPLSIRGFETEKYVAGKHSSYISQP